MDSSGGMTPIATRITQDGGTILILDGVVKEEMTIEITINSFFSSLGMSLKDIVKSLVDNSLKFQQDIHQLQNVSIQFQQETRMDLSNLGTQIT